MRIRRAAAKPRGLQIALALALTTSPLALACRGPATESPPDIQPIAVTGPPVGWDMSTRLMNRQSASTATLSGGGGATASFESISGSMYYNPGNDAPFTGTVVMRADGLRSDDSTLQSQLDTWLEPERHPAFIFQSTGSANVDGGFAVEGNLFLGGQVVVASSRWEAVVPVAIGEDLRKQAELAATISAMVPGAPFRGGVIRLDLTLPVVGYTAEFVRGVLESAGMDIDNLTSENPTYPSSPSDLSNVAWYLMLSGHTARALDVFQMSIDLSPEVNTYLRRSDAYVFDGRYDMAVGSYVALEQYNVGQPHGLELVKVLGGTFLDRNKVDEINRALTGR